MSDANLEHIAAALRALGNADAATPMGAIEAFGLVMKEGLADVAEALREIAESNRELAKAITRGPA